MENSIANESRTMRLMSVVLTEIKVDVERSNERENVKQIEHNDRNDNQNDKISNEAQHDYAPSLV